MINVLSTHHYDIHETSFFLFGQIQDIESILPLFIISFSV